ncbi:hypothetical protein SKAU_G00160420 [Synaphobranchus kaupii]|uniref:Uncharacterized protein n=1 Tax=Synaphobranchus kaupii TaxID=118154 RepID=A0A9Q1FIW0_SYNKA|nr:hypothetical protein SKAU_G00160420 [Synaphobranchus kaupii]
MHSAAGSPLGTEEHTIRDTLSEHGDVRNLELYGGEIHGTIWSPVVPSRMTLHAYKKRAEEGEQCGIILSVRQQTDRDRLMDEKGWLRTERNPKIRFLTTVRQQVAPCVYSSTAPPPMLAAALLATAGCPCVSAARVLLAQILRSAVKETLS